MSQPIASPPRRGGGDRGSRGHDLHSVCGWCAWRAVMSPTGIVWPEVPADDGLKHPFEAGPRGGEFAMRLRLHIGRDSTRARSAALHCDRDYRREGAEHGRSDQYLREPDPEGVLGRRPGAWLRVLPTACRARRSSALCERLCSQRVHPPERIWMGAGSRGKALTPSCPRVRATLVAARSVGEWASADRDRRSDRDQPREATGIIVAEANTAVRDATGDQIWPIRPVDPDDPTAGPVGEGRRPRAGAECDGPVERLVKA